MKAYLFYCLLLFLKGISRDIRMGVSVNPYVYPSDQPFLESNSAQNSCITRIDCILITIAQYTYYNTLELTFKAQLFSRIFDKVSIHFHW